MIERKYFVAFSCEEITNDTTLAGKMFPESKLVIKNIFIEQEIEISGMPLEEKDFVILQEKLEKIEGIKNPVIINVIPLEELW